MSRKTISLTDTLYNYILDISLREHPVLQSIREDTAALPEAKMQISPDQGQFMAFLIRLIGARKVLEIGTFTGYSALAMALALPEDGILIACDISKAFTDRARAQWRRTRVAHRIDLRLGPAKETMDQLLDSGAEGTFDACFIDADKEGYDDYYERALKLLRTGGLIMIDNVLRGGDSASPNTDRPATQAIQRLNRKLHHDTRVHLSIAPIGDGLTLAQKI